LTRIDPDSEQALEHATLKLFEQLGWETVDCYDEVFGDVPASSYRDSRYTYMTDAIVLND
jgi:hypothetical protein